MRILITNDDGINAEGLVVLAVWAKKLGDVTVAAPKCEQSGKSHGIDLHEPFEVRKVPMFDGMNAYSVDSTPADCVRFAFDGLGQDFDMVLAGINCGFNIGLDIVYSGTCGALFEAAAYGKRALAFSTSTLSFASAAKQLDSVYDFITENDLFGYNDIYNVNIPIDVNGIRITRQGGPYYKDNFVTHGDNLYFAEGYSVYKNKGDLDVDTDAVMNGYISVSPLTLERTNLNAYFSLKRKAGLCSHKTK